MSKLLQLRGGTTAEHASFTGAVREVTVDTTKKTLVVHDGATAGGFVVAPTDAEIRTSVEAATDSNVFTDADHSKLNAIEASATADQTKADIDALNINADLLDGQHGAYYTGYADTAVANIVDSSPAALNTLNELAAALGDDANYATTTATSIGTKLPKSGGAMTGAITTNSTFDGRNVSVDGTKLDGIEAGANVTDTANVVAALTAGSNITIASNGTIAGAAQYTHPTHAGDDASVDTGALSGATVISDLDFNITTDTLGHVTDANATVATRNLTLANLGYTGATNANNVTNNNQLANGSGYITSFTNTTYSAGAGLDLSGTTFSIEADLRDGITHVGRDGNDYIAIGTTTLKFYLDGAEDMRLSNNGDLHVEGNVVAYSTTISDERLKTDIVKIDGALDKVAQLNGYTFTYTADGKKSAGVIAQEVQKVLPSAITESTLPLKMGDDDETEYMTVQYDQLMGLMIEAIKELKAEVAELKGK